MRRGAAISGGMHAAVLALVIWGNGLFPERAPVPLNVTEIDLVDGTELDARLSTAPVVQSEGPAEMAPPAPEDSAPAAAAAPDSAAEAVASAALVTVPPPEPRPEEPKAAVPPPPTEIPSEAPAPSIAEIPSPDTMPRQAAEPESPPSTEPVQPLASVRPPTPSPRPMPPPEPEPEAVQTPEPTVAQTPEPAAEAPERPAPAPVQEPSPDSVAEAQPDAPEGLAPREAKLPVAKPAALAAAALAASRQEPPPEPAATTPEKQAPEKPAATRVAESAPTPAKPAGGSSRPTAPLSTGEKNALRLGIRKYYVYNGRPDPSLRVTVRVRLDEQAKIIGKPERVAAEGGNPGAQQALFLAGQRALIQAQARGEFDRLPPEKYGAWKTLNVVFTTEKGVDFSS